MRLTILFLLASVVFLSISRAQAPVFDFTKGESAITFKVKASVAIEGKFDKWDASITFTSPELSTAVLDIKIQAASVNTGSGTKDGKVKSKDFFDAEHNPLITFHSTKVEQTGPDTVVFDGDFTIRGVTKPEKLTLAISGKGTGTGTVKGTMGFDRKNYGMNKGFPLVKIGEFVVWREVRMCFAVTLNLRGFQEWLVTGTRFGVGPVHGFPLESLCRIHPSIAHFAVMRDGEYLATGLLRVGVHILPEAAAS